MREGQISFHTTYIRNGSSLALSRTLKTPKDTLSSNCELCYLKVASIAQHKKLYRGRGITLSDYYVYVFIQSDFFLHNTLRSEAAADTIRRFPLAFFTHCQSYSKALIFCHKKQYWLRFKFHFQSVSNLNQGF